MTYTFNISSTPHIVKEFYNSDYGKIRGFRLLTIIGKQLWYNINNTNNIITWKEDAATALNATIAPGNYTYISLSSAVENAMNACSLSLGFGLNYTVSLDSSTFLSTITVTAGHTVQIIPTGIDLGYIMGFHIISSASSTLISDSCYDLSDNYIELRFINPSISNRHYVNDTFTDGVVSWQIPIIGLSGEIIYFQDTDNGPYKYIQNDKWKSTTTKIEIYNSHNQLLDNRGGNISIVIKLIY